MNKEEIVFDRLCEFINDHDVNCVEDVYQRDSVNESCVELVAELVNIVLEGE